MQGNIAVMQLVLLHDSDQSLIELIAAAVGGGRVVDLSC